jgi:putative heme iron utilization protein
MQSTGIVDGMEHRPIDTEMASLLLANRWAALAVDPDDGPAVSMVAYAVEADGGLLMFLSGLAAHTRALLERRRAAVVVSAPDLGAGDPQELPRLSIAGPVAAIPRDSDEFAAAWSTYSGRFPAAIPRLALADFVLFRLSATGGRFVGGFARALDVHPDRFASAVRLLHSG